MTTPTDTVSERVNGAELLDEVAATITRYVILPGPAALVAVVLWIAATHAIPAWNCAARLVIRAPQRRCGKSRLLDMVEAMCHQPMMTANASPSAVYRSIGLTPSDPPTLLIDEADTIFGPKAGDHEDLRGLLNAGHQRGRPTQAVQRRTRPRREPRNVRHGCPSRDRRDAGHHRGPRRRHPDAPSRCR